MSITLPSSVRLFDARPHALTMDELESVHSGHFFDSDSMRFFRSRIVSDTAVVSPCGLFAAFVTSEKRHGDARRYTVRVMDIFGDILSESATGHTFQEYATSQLANMAVKATVHGENLDKMRAYMKAVYADRAAGLRREAGEIEAFAASL